MSGYDVMVAEIVAEVAALPRDCRRKLIRRLHGSMTDADRAWLRDELGEVDYARAVELIGATS